MRSVFNFSIALCVLIAGNTALAQVTALPTSLPSEIPSAAQSNRQPLLVENRGQWPSAALFSLNTQFMNAWITSTGVTYDFYREESSRAPSDGVVENVDSVAVVRHTGHVVQMRFVAAEAFPEVMGVNIHPTYYNYFIGNDSTRWRAGVRLFEEASVKNVYPGIDVRYYADKGSLRYDFIVAPGADSKKIGIEFDGANKVSIDENGDIILMTRFGAVRQGELLAYQDNGQQRQNVRCSFIMKEDGAIGFDVGEYDSRRPLVIDPIIYATYLGGTLNDHAHGIAIDSAGNTYILSKTFSKKFPTTPGAYDTSLAGSTGDVAVSKLDSAGGKLFYSTYIGGAGDDEFPLAIAIDRSGNAYVTGFTWSTDYPTTAGAFDQTHNGEGDIFVTKVSPDGKRLGYSTFLGGTDTDQGYGITVDGEGRAYVCGVTWATDFPTTVGVHDRTLDGERDAVLSKLNPAGSNLEFSTYLGGNTDDHAFGLALDSSNGVYVVGNTDSPNFPTTAGAYDRTHNLKSDSFIARFGTDGSSLLYATFLGGKGDERAQAVALDGSGQIYIAGHTSSPNFPVTPGAFDTSFNGATDLVVTKLASGGGSLVYSTYIGGMMSDESRAIALNVDGSVSMGGVSGSENFPVTAGAHIDQPAVASMVSVMVQPDGAQLLTSTYIGAGGIKFGAMAFDDKGHLYVAGTTGTPGLVTLPGAYNKDVNGNLDVFVMKIDLIGIIVTSPPAGSVWCPASTMTIRSRISGVRNIAIQLSSDGGVTYPRTLLVSVSSRLEYPTWWVDIETPPASNYRIRVVSREDSTVIGVSGLFTVLPYTAITNHPVDQTVRVGDSVTFAVDASGDSTQYQWHKNGKPIKGATSKRYTISSAKLSDTGSYLATVTGRCGSKKTSYTAKLIVELPTSVPLETSAPGMGITVIPNPAYGLTRLRLPGPPVFTPSASAQLLLVDLLGIPIADLTESFTSSNYTEAAFDATDVPSGVYFCLLKSDSGSTIIGSIIIAK